MTTQVESASGTSTSIVALMMGLNKTDERPHDFTEKLSVEGEVHLGVLPPTLRKLHAVQQKLALEAAVLADQLQRKRAQIKAVGDMFHAGVEEAFPPKVELTQSAIGTSVRYSRTIFFGPGWNVYSAAPSDHKRASLEYRMRECAHREDGHDGHGHDDSIFGGHGSFADMPGLLDMIMSGGLDGVIGRRPRGVH